MSNLSVKTIAEKRLIFMIYGYARVSTAGQERTGNSLDEQRQELEKAGCQEVIAEQYTGTTMNRPKFKELIDKLQDGDTLVVTKLDRFARSAGDGSKLARALLKRGVSLNILNMGQVNNTTTGRLMLNILLAFAEFERDMIVERTQAGKAIARTKEGFKEGRPRIKKERTDNAVKLINEGHSYREVVEMTGLSKSTIIRAVRAYRASKEAE